jgi:hypothetical protein
MGLEGVKRTERFLTVTENSDTLNIRSVDRKDSINVGVYISITYMTLEYVSIFSAGNCYILA